MEARSRSHIKFEHAKFSLSFVRDSSLSYSVQGYFIFAMPKTGKNMATGSLIKLWISPVNPLLKYVRSVMQTDGNRR